MKKILTTCVGAALLAACGPTNNGNQIALLDGQWTISEIDGTVIDENSAPAEILFDIEDMTFSSNAGCNSMNGQLYADVTKAGNISFDLQAVTRMMCPDMQNESKLQDAFQKIVKFEIDTTQAVRFAKLIDKDGNVLVKMNYMKKSEVEEWSIKGTWKIVSVRGENVDQTESSTDLYFDLDNSLLGGNSGCNSIGGGVSVSDEGIVFSDLYVTEMMCDDHSMEVEKKIVDNLALVTRWSVANAELRLEDEDGNVLFALVRE